ncbi:MAG: glutamate--tRNA ligase [Verrucomicrobia bacterium GWF2_51_19]|nr:MAG: glutamate--tRNA ligase [Verrucomicrobia bacterium GWF2_51_19]HCJ11573.1 glutamate--tRNA ligase [Opitutae bacterium]
MSTVRVRFAPSPTGFFHIGSARTALFNWLYAKHTGGTFILRIEDTDTERNTDIALKVLIDGMRWLGMDWDEGPEVGGPYGPYFQSQRADIYREYLKRIQQTGRVYEKEGALLFRVSEEAQIINDAIRGRVERKEDKDFVIVRSNGQPVFHLVNVVDDIAMKITHVIRGEDHLSNTSKHVELFNAFGAPMPIYAHIPLILKTEGAGKMSKRDTGALIEDYQKRGFLPEAIRNFLCLLGWSPKDDREILTIEELIRLFDLPAINKNNARFDVKKLSFINTEYVRTLPKDVFFEKGRTALHQAGIDCPDEAYMRSVLVITQEKVRSFEDLPHFIDYFFTDTFQVDTEAQKKLKSDSASRLQEFQQAILNIDWTEAALEKVVLDLANQHGVKSGDYIHAVRFAVSGRSVGPSFYSMLYVLGKEKTLSRLKRPL